jgi:glycosyltransferase involved in cell wall biosynthesis
MRVCIAPYYKGEDRGDGGIRRVVEAQIKYLPQFGWDVTDNPDEADLIACHGATLVERAGVPMVCHNHGLMWEDYFAHHLDDVNKHAIDVMVRAHAITAPSHWVAQAISRGMLVRPEVIHHGVDADDWASADPPLDYILWNKARMDPVSSPADMQMLAARMPDLRFITTYGEPSVNVLPTGVGTYEQMRPIVQRAALYLATPRETFGIGTLEALAAGVPVVGWDYGGQHEIIRQEETGILVPFGDFGALAAAVRQVLADRSRYSERAIADVRARWGWTGKIAQYADLYTRTVEAWTAPRPKVSVVVTCYNLARYLPDACKSIAEQTTADHETIVVDDCGDDGAEVKQLCANYNIHYLRTPQNLGLAGARNYGWRQSRGRYVLFLDADDLLAPNALDILGTALDRDSSIHIAYGALDTMSEDGSNRQRNPWPAGAFSWQGQIAHLNQLHGSALMRREVLERSGGYRVRDWRAEDASFWTRVTSFGFRAARVTDDTIQIYRMHDGQKSRGEPGDGDWTAWLPWRLAADPHAGLAAIRQGVQPNARIVPFGAQGSPPAPMKAWPVRHFEHPVVSVIIPVGPGHAEPLIDALDSVQAQTFPEWECIVVNDTGAPLDLTPWPWARAWDVNRIVDDRGIARMGAGAARNWGLRHASAPFVVFLDADDLLHPRFLEETLKTYDGHYVYTDWATLQDPAHVDSEADIHTVETYNQRRMLQGLLHAVTTLLPTAWAHEVGGFDEQLKVFEDWDFYCKLAVSGYCGARLDKPLLIYRYQHGQRTRQAIKAQDAYTPLGEEAAAAIADRYTPWRSGEEVMMGCCGGGNQQAASAALNDMIGFATNGVAARAATPAVQGNTVRMEFIGGQQGAQTFYGKESKLPYRAGREQGARFLDVDPRDVEYFVATGSFRVVEPPVNTVDEVASPADPRGGIMWPVPKGRLAQ